MADLSTPAARAAFIRAQTRLRPVPHVPEIMLHLADEAVPLWSRTEEELGEIGLPPPYWAFAWAGGQALARYLLDRPAAVAGLRVLDLASGSGLVAIAAAKAGAASVEAAEIDAFAEVAIGLNAAHNAAHKTPRIVVTMGDRLDDPVTTSRYDVVLVGDLFYEQPTAQRVLIFLLRHAACGAAVLIGDPGRSYLPRERLLKLAEYQVPVTRDLEDAEIKNTAVWTLRPDGDGHLR